MAERARSGDLLVASVLDRLLDSEPGKQTETRRSRTQDLREIRESVRRDVEHLLNVRRRCLSVPKALVECNQSLLNYGMPDLTNVNAFSQSARSDLCRLIETLLQRFEPRFKSVSIKLLDNADPLDSTLRFRIEALMHAEPAPEPIVFDSFVEPVTRNVALKDVTHD